MSEIDVPVEPKRDLEWWCILTSRAYEEVHLVASEDIAAHPNGYFLDVLGEPLVPVGHRFLATFEDALARVATWARSTWGHTEEWDRRYASRYVRRNIELLEKERARKAKRLEADRRST